VPTDARAPDDPCAHLTPPPPPDVDDDPSFSLTPFVLAVSKIDVASAGLGFDLDGVCSCDTRAGAAHDGGASCSGVPQCDGDGGVDDALTGLGAFEVVKSVDDALGVNFNITSGITTVLLLVTGYNGRANDKEVTVGFVLSEGIRDGSGCPAAGVGPNATGVYPPGWCGNDVWTVQKDLVSESSPPYTPTLNTAGYVTNHRLVIPGGDTFVHMLIGPTEAKFGSPIFVGTLTPLAEDLSLRDPSSPPRSRADRFYRIDDGVFAGRLSDASLLAVVGGVVLERNKQGGPSSYLCNSPLFADLKHEICTARDVAGSRSLDFDPNVACSALSMAYHLTALPAVPGDPLPPTVATNPCLPGPSALPNLSTLYTCGD
jgi:hypothetical protein